MFSTMMRHEIQKQAVVSPYIAGGLGGAIGGAIPLAAIGAGAGALFAPEGESAENAKRWGRRAAIAGALLGGFGGIVGIDRALNVL